MIGPGCPVVGLEGTHGSGKSTLAHALVARLRQAGYGPVLLDDAGRSSPFPAASSQPVPGDLQEIWHMAARMKAELAAAVPRPGVVVCDKTVIGGFAYIKVVAPESLAGPVARAAEALAVEYSRRVYDLVVLLDRAFDWTKDPVVDHERLNRDLQARYRDEVRAQLERAAVPCHVITDVADPWDTAGELVALLTERGLLSA